MEDLIKNLIPMCENALSEGKHTFWAAILNCALDHPAIGVILAFLIISGIKKKLHY